MSTLTIAGYKGQVQMSTSSTGGALTKLAEIKTFTLTIEADDMDTTTAESSGDREFIVGLRKWSAKIDQLWSTGYTQNLNLIDFLTSTSTGVNRQKLSFDFFPTGSTSTASGTALVGTGYVKSWELQDEDSRVALSAVMVQGSGALTRA